MNATCNYNSVCELLVNDGLWKLRWGLALQFAVGVTQSVTGQHRISLFSEALELLNNFLSMSSPGIILTWGICEWILDLCSSWELAVNAEAVPPAWVRCPRRKPGPAGRVRERVGSASQSGDEGIGPVGRMADSATLEHKRKQMNVSPASISINWPCTIFPTNTVWCRSSKLLPWVLFYKCRCFTALRTWKEAGREFPWLTERGGLAEGLAAAVLSCGWQELCGKTMTFRKHTQSPVFPSFSQMMPCRRDCATLSPFGARPSLVWTCLCVPNGNHAGRVPTNRLFLSLFSPLMKLCM